MDFIIFVAAWLLTLAEGAVWLVLIINTIVEHRQPDWMAGALLGAALWSLFGSISSLMMNKALWALWGALWCVAEIYCALSLAGGR